MFIDKQIEFLLLRDFQQSFFKFSKEIALACNFSERAYQVPVKVSIFSFYAEILSGVQS